MTQSPLKGTLAWDFWFEVIWLIKPIEDLDKHPEIFSILVLNLPRYSTFWAFCIFSVYVLIHFAYFQYMNRFISLILSIQTDSFCVFSAYEQQNFIWRFTSFRVFSAYIQILSAYSQYTNRLIQCILSIPTESFRVFRECAQIILNIRNGIIFYTAFKWILLQKKYACVQLDQRPPRNNRLFGPT